MKQPAAEVSGVSSLSDADRERDVNQVVVLSPPQAASGRGFPPLRPPRNCSPSPKQSDEAEEEALEDKNLVELLQKASRVIKDERARSAALQQELDELRISNSALSFTRELQKENQRLKKELMSLHKQIDQMQLLNYPLGPLREVEQEDQQQQQQQQQKKSSGSPPPSRGDSVSSKRSAMKTPLTHCTLNMVPGKNYSDAQHTKKQTVSLQRQRLLAPRDNSGGRESTEQQQRRSPSVVRRATPSLAPPTVPPTEKEEAVAPRSRSKHVAAEDLWRAGASCGSGTEYSVAMITRLRRAMAPPPTKEQLGEVIHAMVQEIVRDTRRRGINLQMTRQSPCVYHFGYRGIHARRGKSAATRVVHLSIDSGQLTVKVGGGHENFLDYLERYRSSSAV
ncbi:putative protein kinase [Trypanosoma grayi]|uniref:putative protein kinase n=1 Tax=Trypanosoma grayi TaxID=71804 RepID=UPI0004F41915|nr:putative protein kinase [Trypanosoma grayi]KEG13433.1 putative protein kinase [Trypanosoma grayi]